MNFLHNLPAGTMGYTDTRMSLLDACGLNKMLRVESLIGEGADVNQTGNQDMTPLHLAAMNGSDRVVKILLNTGRVNKHAKDSKGRTALHLASENGHDKVVALLIK